MDTKKIQAWLTQHKFEVGLFTVVLGVIAFIAIHNKSSSKPGQGKATLDTIHNDLVTVDFDLNQLMTTSVTNPWVSNLGVQGSPFTNTPNIPSQAIGQSPKTVTAPGGVGLNQLIAQYYNTPLQSIQGSATEYDVIAANQGVLSGYQNDLSQVVPQGTQLILPDLPSSVTGQGEERPQSNYTWSFKGMGLEGQQLPDAFFADEYHQLEPGGAGIWGDYNSPVRLN